MTQPLCGQKWLDKHKNDHSQAEIDALTIEVILPNNRVIKVFNRAKRKTVKDIMEQHKVRRMK